VPLREFQDASGRDWEVWSTQPGTSAPATRSALDKFMRNQPKEAGVQPASVRHRFVAGWLTFSSGHERRRLSPIPERWETASDEMLRAYLDGAEVMGKPQGQTRQG
jgi:hypothetical protein